MLPTISILETLLLGAAIYLAWRRSRPATPPFTRDLLLIIVLVALQFGLLVGHFLLIERNWHVAGFSWTVQALRAASCLTALATWFRLVRWQGTRRRDVVLFGVALLALAFGTGGLSIAGGLLVFVLATKLRWPQELHGFRRALFLLLTPVLIACVTIQSWTEIKVAGGGDTTLTIGHLRPPLMTGALSAGQAREMLLAVPFDRAVDAILGILRAQFVVLFLRLLTLPVQLRGMSLKRRFMFNYVFIRLVPATLSLITIALLIYFGYGLTRVAQVRHDFEATLDREFDLAVAMTRQAESGLESGKAGEAAPGTVYGSGAATNPIPSSTSGSPDSSLLAYRAWLGPDGARAAIALRRSGPGGMTTETTPGFPAALLSDSLFVPADRDSAAGLIEAGGGLYLAAQHRLTSPWPIVAPMAVPVDSVYLARVAVPVDSIYLVRLATRAGVDIGLAELPGVFIGSTQVKSAADTSWTSNRIAYHAPLPTRADPTRFFGKRRYLGRAFLPVGDWRSTNFEGFRGAVQLTVKTGLADLLPSPEKAGFLITTNIVTFLFLILMVIVIAITESLAVRTGRGIITAILTEVTSLRDAVLRIGRGDLDYRIPVQGKDEIAALSSSVNQMAEDLKRQQAELVEKERLEADLMVARQIQQRFLPQSAPVIPGLDVAGVSIPSREVGGDLFYFLPLEDDRLGVALGDVSGKSVPAALLMSNVLAALRTEARLHADINESLGRLNELIVEQVEPGRFVTLFYGLVDSRAGRIHYTSAGHNPPLLVRSSGEIQWLEEAGVPLGVLPEVRYGSAVVPFHPGDVLVLYSDGITEAMKAVGSGAATAEANSEDDMQFFDEERLATAVIQLRQRPAAAVLAGILDAVNDFARGTPQADDMTLVVIRMK